MVNYRHMHVIITLACDKCMRVWYACVRGMCCCVHGVKGCKVYIITRYDCGQSIIYDIINLMKHGIYILLEMHVQQNLMTMNNVRVKLWLRFQYR